MNDQDAQRLRKALLAIVSLKEELAAERQKSLEPIAIVSMGCRYPGGIEDPASFRRLLEEGRDGTSSVPPERWDSEAIYSADPTVPGTSYCRRGGFLTGSDRFDAQFFGLGAQEARALDPQHRLLLEVAWETIERAGLTQERLQGTQTGVFAGLMYNDYPMRVVGTLEDLDGYLGTGSAPSVAVGRLSYVLGLEGPSVALDTACSSSLVAIHLACQSLRGGECDRAFAGGVTLMQLPTTFVEFSLARGIAPDGRCKSFSAQADGVGWGEGCGLLLLRRLSDALRDADPIVGLIRGTAVTQDGRSQGLTAPNGPSQERAIRRALGAAGLSPHDIDYVEGHGTGTTLGDPIEARALSAVFGPGRPAGRPLYLGSVKSNIAHAQAAAGVAGVMKAVLALEAQAIFPTLHAEEGSPHVDWAKGTLELARDSVPWSRGARVRRAGVSGFGIGGTNAHVIVEEAPAAPGNGPKGVHLDLPLLISAKSEASLRAQAGRWAAWLEENPEVRLLDVAYTAAARRAHFDTRATVRAATHKAVVGALRALAGGQEHPALSLSQPTRSGRVAMLFTGQGSQRPGMGAELAARFPSFRRALGEVCQAFDVYLDRPLLPVMMAEAGSEEASLLSQTAWAQPALCAFELALVRFWGSLGVQPELLLGHSLGEVTAACIAGVFSLEAGARFVVARGRAMQRCRGGGAMLSVAATQEEVLRVLEGSTGAGIAARNGERQVVVSGDEAAVLAAGEALAKLGRRTQRLAVSHAFHSAHMDAALPELMSVLRDLELRPPIFPIISNVTGRRLSTEEAQSPTYWAEQVRMPVRFFEGLQALYDEEGATTFLECGPDAVLTSLAVAAAPKDLACRWLPSARRGQGEVEAVASALGALELTGAALEWPEAFAGTDAAFVPGLPTYAFMRRRYWFEGRGDDRAWRSRSKAHPLTGEGGPVAGTSLAAYSVGLSASRPSWLSDHRVHGQILLPGAAFLEMLRAVAAQASGLVALSEVVFLSPVQVPSTGEVRVQMTLSPGEEGETRVGRIFCASTGAEGAWRLCAEAKVVAPEVEGLSLGEPPLTAERVRLDPLQLYAGLSERGLQYGPAFQLLRSARADGKVVWAELELPEAHQDGAADYGVHPALLDAAIQAVALAIRAEGAAVEDGAAYLPFAVQRFELWKTGCHKLWAKVRVDARSDAGVRATIELYEAGGAPVGLLAGLELRRVAEGASSPRPSSAYEYQVTWEAVDPGRPHLAGKGPSRLGLLGVGTDASPLRLAVERGLCEGRGVVVPIQSLAEVEERGLDGLVSVFDGAGAEDVPERAQALAAQALAQLQLLSRQPALRLIWVTAGAVRPSREEPSLEAGLASSPIWGLARSARSERPELALRLVDLPATADLEPVDLKLLSELCTQPFDEHEVAIRDARLWAPRLTQVRGAATLPPPPAEPWGAALLTGGLGGLGRQVAKWLARERRVRQVVVATRRLRPEEDLLAFRQELEALGASLTVVAADVADDRAMEALLHHIPSEHPLRGVVHAAGVLDDALLDDLTPARLEAVMAPKVRGSWNLHRMTQDLEFFVLFSSAAGVLGAPGQGNYAAANVFLDRLSEHRRALGLASVSIAWGPWAGEGMAANLSPGDRERMRRQGFRELSPEAGLRVLGDAWAFEAPVIAGMDLDTGGLQQAVDKMGAQVPPLFRRLLRAPATSVAKDGIRGQLLAAPPLVRKALLLAAVKREVARALGISPEDGLRDTDTFRDLGLESLSAVQLRNRLVALTGVHLLPAALFEHPTVLAVTEVLLEELSSASEVAPLAEPAPAAALAVPMLAGRSLLDRFAAKKLPGVQAATFVSIPDGGLAELGVDRERVRQELLGGLPSWGLTFETQLGRIAGIMLPVFTSEVYRERERLLEACTSGLELARLIGARCVSLTALLPSALDYGVALAERIQGQDGLPAITTGHATTTAAICLNIAELLQEAGRSLEEEDLAVLGVGSIGTNVLRLMLEVLPHPRSIRLCDLYARRGAVEKVAAELTDRHGYRGRLELLSGDEGPPGELYEARLIIGATNVEGVLDLKRVAPGTLLLDDSFPHCFKVQDAIERIERAQDVLFTEAGPVRAREVIPRIAAIPGLGRDGGATLRSLDALTQASPELQGCMFSSVLSATFADLPPTIGPITVEQSRLHFERLKTLGFTGTELQCDGYALRAEDISEFRRRFGRRGFKPSAS